MVSMAALLRMGRALPVIELSGAFHQISTRFPRQRRYDDAVARVFGVRPDLLHTMKTQDSAVPLSPQQFEAKIDQLRNKQPCPPSV